MIGVCIKYFHENYGGMLQAFATTKLLEELGINYEIIQYKKKPTLIHSLRSMPRLLNNVLLNDKYELLQKKISMKLHPDYARMNEIRMKAFDKFKNERFLKLSEVYRGYDELSQGALKYEAVLTGSDQLWSPAGLPTNFYNLQFVPDQICKISYASSFGVKHIPFYQKKRTAAYLRRFQHISMRENRGSDIVKELINKDVITILDPVFMFDEAGWNRLIPKKQEYKEPYIFAYFLGRNSKYREEVKQLASKTGLKIVALRHLDQYVKEDEQFGDYAPYDVDPAKFLNLLRGAAYVCTDSFHGTVFSIIHRKKFIVFNRYEEASKHSKNSRIDTLCSNFSLEERRYAENLYEAMIKEIDYSSLQEKYKSSKLVADQYLEASLSRVSKINYGGA